MNVFAIFCLALCLTLGYGQDVPTTPATPSILGSYTLTDTARFTEYMEDIGVGWWLRTMAAAATPTTIISKTGDDWEIKTETTFKTTDIKFKLGQEFDENTADGRQCKSKITLESPTKMLHKQNCGTSPSTEIIREFEPTRMTMILPFYSDSTKNSTRIYKKN